MVSAVKTGNSSLGSSFSALPQFTPFPAFLRDLATLLEFDFYYNQTRASMTRLKYSGKNRLNTAIPLQKYYPPTLVLFPLRGHSTRMQTHTEITDQAAPSALPETLLPQRINWLNALILTTTPPAAVLGLVFYIHGSGFALSDLGIFLTFYALSGMGITAGYHRLLAHRAYQANPVVKFILLGFGASALQNSALSWVSDHRYHHQHTDEPADPYNIQRGFFWAHMGWIFFKPETERVFPNVPDLKKDRIVMWQHRNYLKVAAFFGLVLPLAAGYAFGRPGAGLVWGCLLRLVVVHHATFLINSAAHTFGHRPHSDHLTARDSWWLPYFSYGEGYHNYHHAFPSDYRNGVAWHHFDPTKWLIRTLSFPGWTYALRRSSRTEST